MLRTKLGEVAELTDPVTMEACADPAGRTWAQVLADQLLLLATRGNLRAIEDVIEQTDGKLTNKIQAVVQPKTRIEYNHKKLSYDQLLTLRQLAKAARSTNETSKPYRSSQIPDGAAR